MFASIARQLENETIAPLGAEIDAYQKEQGALDLVERRLAFQVEPRPIPKGLLHTGIPPGHIALMGGFDIPPSPQQM